MARGLVVVPVVGVATSAVILMMVMTLSGLSAPLKSLASDPVLTSSDRRGDSGVTAMGLVIRSPEHDSQQPKEFFGDSSTISFINQLRDTLKPAATTPTPRQERTQSNQKPSLQQGNLIESLPPRPLADHLIDCYFSKVHTLYPFVHKPAFLALYNSLWIPQPAKPPGGSTQGLGLGDEEVSPQTFYFGLNAIFAQGCQFSTMIQAERENTSEAFIRLCKPALDMDYLEGGDLALNQTILLISHYLQASRTPNRCWHVIGIACRVGQALGLHSNVGDGNRSFAEVQMRRRVWHGCVMLDLAGSTMLGRPAMISQIPTTPLPDPIDDCYLIVENSVCHQPANALSRVAWFVETLKLYIILRKALSTLYDNIGPGGRERSDDLRRENILQIQQIIEIDSDLQEFKDRLPQALNWDLSLSEESLLRERCLLKARYTHLNVLLYRPVLSQFVRGTRSTTQTTVQAGMHPAGMYSKYHLDYAADGVLAAIDLAALIHETCRTELSSVWFYNIFYSFTAGSVLLLAELSPAIVNMITRDTLDKAWDQCQDSLSYLSVYSSTAGRCAETLSMIRSKCSGTVDAPRQPNDSQPEQSVLDTEATDDRCIPSDATPYPPGSDGLFGDLDLNENTLFDPFWFNFQF
ncbi:hypothetical protein FE257_011375 [Aspergillus nanangensis]|uniref:Xylanolytic transcriptional activator regulatory domain-containing protein n=1 Tax=Aspergillus nanangensis TaxID=2582783 RepID=A0AAD4GSJ7_ASPNN|nr:hypothetical protein FE257_011375 [Aspergillus nanangensis]